MVSREYIKDEGFLRRCNVDHATSTDALNTALRDTRGEVGHIHTSCVLLGSVMWKVLCEVINKERCKC